MELHFSKVENNINVLSLLLSPCTLLMTFVGSQKHWKMGRWKQLTAKFNIEFSNFFSRVTINITESSLLYISNLRTRRDVS